MPDLDHPDLTLSLLAALAGSEPLTPRDTRELFSIIFKEFIAVSLNLANLTEAVNTLQIDVATLMSNGGATVPVGGMSASDVMTAQAQVDALTAQVAAIDSGVQTMMQAAAAASPTASSPAATSTSTAAPAGTTASATPTASSGTSTAASTPAGASTSSMPAASGSTLTSTASPASPTTGS